MHVLFDGLYLYIVKSMKNIFMTLLVIATS